MLASGFIWRFKVRHLRCLPTLISGFSCLRPGDVWCPLSGVSAKWLPVFLGLRSVRGRILLLAIALNSGGVLLALAGAILPATLLTLTGLVTAITALRLFEPSERPAKVKGVHVSFPFFVRLAYLWALIAAFLSLWAALSRDPSGIWGASRHALTVGFLATMVFAIGASSCFQHFQECGCCSVPN